MTSEAPSDEQSLEPEALHEVWLLGYPLRLGVRASEHYESVYREFALLAASDSSPSSVPSRMIALVERLGTLDARNNAHEQEREAALLRGEECLDIRLKVPRSAAAVSQELASMLDETDDYCRQGVLLTLAPADDVVAFRRWYIEQLVRQLDGAPPRRWPGEPS